MADKRILQERVVKFGITGLNEVYDAQKKIRDNAAKALKEQKELLALTKEGTEAYKAQQKIVEKANKEYERQNKLFQDLGKQANTVLDVINNKTVESGKKIDTAIKAIMKGVKSISFKGLDAGETEKLRQHIAGLVKDLVGLQAQSGAISTGFQDMTAKMKTSGLSIEEMTRYIKTYEQSGRALADNYANSSAAFDKMSETATRYKVKVAELDGTIVRLNKNTSKGDLERMVQFWKDMGQYSGASAAQVEQFGKKYEKVMSYLSAANQKIASNPSQYTAKEVEESVKWLQQYQQQAKLSEAEQLKLNQSILQGSQYLKQLTLDQQRYSMTLQLGGKQMANIKTLSDASLASQKKYWTEMVANTQQGTAEYYQYLATLKAVTDEEQRRASTQVRKEGANLVVGVNNGQFKGTIQETEEAIKKMQEYKRTLSGDSEAGKNAIMATERAIATLNESLAKTSTEAINGEKAFKQLGDAAKQGVDEVTTKLPASSEALKKMRSDLEAYKKSLKNPDTSQLKQIETIFTAIDKKEREVAADEIQWSKFQGAELKKRSLKELRDAYDRLKKKMETMTIDQKEFNEEAMKMRMIDGQIKNMNKSMGHHVSSLENAASRLKNYVMIYLGFNAAMMKARQLMSDVMKLSDQMVNVQKVTQMSNEEVERLVRNIQDLDTRTSTENLMAFAEQAGKLGIYTKNGLEGMKQFVEMGDRISKTLGEDIGGAQAIADLAKVNDIMNVTARTMERTGNEATVMRDALNATGSAILNVGNNSAASYGAIVEYVGRLGAISASSGIAMEQTVALGGALDALKMPAEAGSTALSQFINAVVRNTDAMAQAAKVSVVELRNLIQSGQTYKAVTLLFSKVADGTTTAQKLMDAMTGRSRTNVNIRNVIQLLSGHMELLNKQLEYAQSGFESAFSQKTANDVQLIMAALRGIGKEGSIKAIEEMYRFGTMGKDVASTAKALSAAGYDLRMLEQAISSVYGAMDRLREEGKLTAESMEMLAQSTGQASVMEQEFERVNESAAARFERLGRMIHEQLVNEESVKFWSDMSSGLMDFITWMQSGETGARMLGTALASLIAYLIAVKVRLHELIAVQLWGWFKNVGNAILNATTSTINFRRALVSLKNFLATNWITLAATAIAGLVYWLKSASDESMRFAKAAAEASEALADETKEAAMLFAQLKNTNSASAERARLIDLINSKYGLILKNMSDEVQFARQLETSYKLVVAQLREKSRLQLGETLFQNAKESAQNEQKKGAEGLNKVFEANKGSVTAEQAGAFMGAVSALISAELVKNPKASVDEIFKAIEKRLPAIGVEQEMTTAAGRQYSYATTMAKAGEEDIKRIIRGMQNEITINERTARFLNGYGAGDIEYSRQAAEGKVMETVNNLNGTFKKFNKNRKDVSDEELNNALEQLNFVLNNTTINQAAERDKNSAMYKNIKAFRGWVTQMSAEQTRRAGITPWGDSSTAGKAMEDWTTEALQAYHKKLSNTAIAAAPNADWSQIFPDIIGLKQGMTVQEVQKFVDEEDEKVQEILKSRHMGLTDFQHPKDKSGGESKIKTEMKEEMDATLKKLEEYYERRNMLAEKYLNEGQISEEEYNRYMFANEQEHLMERQNLRKKWLDNDHDFMTEGVKDLMSGVDFAKLSNFLKGMGQDMVDGIKLNIAKDENEVEKNIRASREKVMKVLLDERPIAKVAESFTKDLAELGVLFGDADEAILRTGEETQQMMIDRMSFLMDEAKKGYALTAEQLIKDAKKVHNPYIETWIKGLSPQALSALVLKTQGFYDEYEDAVRKMVKKMEKRIEFERNQVGDDGMSQNQRWEESKARLSRRQQTQGVAESWSMAGNDVAGVVSSERTRIELLQKELEIKREQYELDKKRYAEELEAIKMRIFMEGDPKERAALMQEAEALKTASLMAEQEAWKGIQEAQREATETQFELMSKSVDQIKPYYDNLNSFAESFGENIFGSKEDRQQASRELLANVIKTTGQMLTQWLVYISTKRLFDKMEILNEEVKQKQLLAIKLNAQAAEMTALGQQAQAEEAVKQAQNLTDAASAQAKEAAKAGWVGWAIGAGLSLLMTMVFSALSAKAKSAISSATGVSNGAGKLATGMLTYGKGRYPVYADGVYANDGNGRVQGQLVSVKGNDGVNYMAKYQPNLQTGEVNGPHLGIVGEKGAELIVDHGTYENLKQYDPETLRRIYAMKQYGMRSIDFSRTSRMGNEVLINRGGVRAYADGNIESKLGNVGMDGNDGNDAGTVTQMQQTLAELTMVLAAIKATGIPATMSYLGANGAQKQMEKGDKFLKRVGLKK